jgi:hypothetical protein
MTQIDFQKNQYEFFDMHKSKFSEEEEENKLEHTQIHQEYVNIMDQIIEVKLADKFSEDAINHFYSGFQDQIETYKSIDDLGMEILWGFIDFTKFKEAILKFKKGGQEFTPEQMEQHK